MWNIWNMWNSLGIILTEGKKKLLIIIIIIIINDNVYGAVLMTMVTARVHPVHLMNAD